MEQSLNIKKDLENNILCNVQLGSDAFEQHDYLSDVEDVFIAERLSNESVRNLFRIIKFFLDDGDQKKENRQIKVVKLPDKVGILAEFIVPKAFIQDYLTFANILSSTNKTNKSKYISKIVKERKFHILMYRDLFFKNFSDAICEIENISEEKCLIYFYLAVEIIKNEQNIYREKKRFRFNFKPREKELIKISRNCSKDIFLSIYQEIEDTAKTSKIFSGKILCGNFVYHCLWNDKLGLLKNLTKLSYIDNKESETLPHSIWKLTKLEEFEYLGGGYETNRTKLKYIPEEIGLLSNLKKIDISGTQIETLPDAIGCLKKLEILRLHTNRLSELPETMQELTKLKRLALDHNYITTIPAFFSKFQQLETLSLRGNYIRVFPTSLCKLVNLKNIDIRNNKIHEIPQEAINLQYVKDIKTGENPIIKFPFELYDKFKFVHSEQSIYKNLYTIYNNIDEKYFLKNEDFDYTKVLKTPSKQEECTKNLFIDLIKEYPVDIFETGIYGGSTYWRCWVKKAKRKCIINCFYINHNYQYAVIFSDGDELITGRTFSKQDTLGAIKTWLAFGSKHLLCESFDFVDETIRRLQEFQFKVLYTDSEIERHLLAGNLSIEIIKEQAPSISIRNAKKNRWCNIYYFGLDDFIISDFYWGEQFIFKIYTNHEIRINDLIMDWLCNNVSFSHLQKEYKNLEFKQISNPLTDTQYMNAETDSSENTIMFNNEDSNSTSNNSILERKYVERLAKELMENYSDDKYSIITTKEDINKSCRILLNNEYGCEIKCSHYIDDKIIYRGVLYTISSIPITPYTNKIKTLSKKYMEFLVEKYLSPNNSYNTNIENDNIYEETNSILLALHRIFQYQNKIREKLIDNSLSIELLNCTFSPFQFSLRSRRRHCIFTLSALYELLECAFYWEETFIYEMRTKNEKETILLVKMWLCDNALPIKLKEQFPSIDLGKLSLYYQEHGIYGKFMQYWKEFPKILSIIKEIIELGISELIRAIPLESFLRLPIEKSYFKHIPESYIQIDFSGIISIFEKISFLVDRIEILKTHPKTRNPKQKIYEKINKHQKNVNELKEKIEKDEFEIKIKLFINGNVDEYIIKSNHSAQISEIFERYKIIRY